MSPVIRRPLARPLHGPIASGGLRRACALGAVAGAASVVRAEFGLCALLLAPFLWWGTGPAGRRLLTVGAYALGFVLLLIPSTVAHWRGISEFNTKFVDLLPAPLSRFAPVTSYGGFNFAHAFHSYTDGTTNLDLLVRAPKDPVEEALVAEGKLDITQPVSYDLYVNGYRIGFEWILGHPTETLILIGKKVRITAGALALGYLQDNRIAGVAGTRRRVDQLDPTVRWLWPVHLALATIGVWVLRRQRRTLWLLALPLATLGAALMFFGYVRLGVVYTPGAVGAAGCRAGGAGRVGTLALEHPHPRRAGRGRHRPRAAADRGGQRPARPAALHRGSPGAGRRAHPGRHHAASDDAADGPMSAGAVTVGRRRSRIGRADVPGRRPGRIIEG